MSRRGVLLVLAGTSGAGKGTIGKALLRRDPSLHWSVSWASRPSREGEIDGIDYHFVTRQEFERLRESGGFLEWFEVYGDLKGTPRAPVLENLAAGHDVLLEVDIQGALAVKEQFPEALLVFVQAPSRQTQRERILARGQDSSEAVERRLALAAAEEEIGRASFDAVVTNDDLEAAVEEVAAILGSRRAGR